MVFFLAFQLDYNSGKNDMVKFRCNIHLNKSWALNGRTDVGLCVDCILEAPAMSFSLQFPICWIVDWSQEFWGMAQVIS